MKPLIGITADKHRVDGRDWNYQTNDYFRAVQLAGGIPVLLPYVETAEAAGEVLDRIDGLLLSGGVDVDPLTFGELPHPKQGSIAPERDITELLIIKLALARDMAILGICRGHQMLAVAAGGTLWQDLPEQVPSALKHAQQAPRWYPSHPVRVMPGTKLAELVGAGDIRVNSFHHQAVKHVPHGWISSGVSPDGINEALEHSGYKFVLSVQWHPENFAGRAGYNFDKLFQAFVAAAGRKQ